MSLTSSSVFLLATNFCLVCLTCYWAVSAWRRLYEARTESRWLPSICTIQSSALVPRQSPTEPGAVEYCPMLGVRANYTDASNVLANVSFRDIDASLSIPGEPDDSSCSTNTTRLAAFLAAQFPAGRTDRCWVSLATPHLVAYEDLSSKVGRDKFNIVAISTVVSVSAVLSLAAVMFLVFMPYQTITLPDTLLTPISVAARPGALSRAEVDEVIAIAREADANAKDVASEDRVCAICLEDGLGARLPCGHAYHPECIKKWLMRGSDTCPLCLAVINAPSTPSSATTASPREGDECFSPVSGNQAQQADIPLTALTMPDSANMNASIRILPPVGRRTFHGRVPGSQRAIPRQAPPARVASASAGAQNDLEERRNHVTLSSEAADEEDLSDAVTALDDADILDHISVPDTVSDMQVVTMAMPLVQANSNRAASNPTTPNNQTTGESQ